MFKPMFFNVRKIFGKKLMLALIAGCNGEIDFHNRNMKRFTKNTIYGKYKRKELFSFFCQNRKVFYPSNCQHHPSASAYQHQMAWEINQFGKMASSRISIHHSPFTTHVYVTTNWNKWRIRNSSLETVKVYSLLRIQCMKSILYDE